MNASPKQSTLLRSLLILAIPSASFTVLTHGYRIVDQYFVKSISVPAHAALSASVFVMILLYASFEVVSGGIGPLVARATGARDEALRKRVIGRGATAAFGISLVLSMVGYFGAGIIADSLGLSTASRAEFIAYLQPLSLTILPLTLTPLIDQAFVSMGDARTPLLLHAVSIGLNIIITPIMIHDLEMGIAGAALASNASRAVATGWGFVLLSRTVGLRIEHFRLTTNGRVDQELRRITRIGFPVALGTALYAAVYWAMIKTSVSPLGDAVQAALGIGFSALENVSWPIFHGLSLAVASMVGRSLGAGDPLAARRLLRVAVPTATLLGMAATLVFLLLGRPLTALLTDSPLVHQEAILYASVLAYSQIFVAWEALEEGVLLGAGDARTVFWLSVPFNLVRVPLAWWMAFELGMGAAGIWWAINITTYAKTLLKGWAVIRGRWMTLAV